MRYDSGASFEGNWIAGEPDAAELRRRNPPPAPVVGQQQQRGYPTGAYPAAAHTGVGAAPSVCPSLASSVYMGGHGGSVAASASARPMYGNPNMIHGGYNNRFNNVQGRVGGGVPMMNHPGGGPGMMIHSGMMQHRQQQQMMMNGQMSPMMMMMGPQQGMAPTPMSNGYHAVGPRQQMPPPGVGP